MLYEISAGREANRFPELPTAWEEFADQKGQLELNAIILKACAHDARQRYQTAREMHDDLALLQRGKSVRAKHTRQQRQALAAKFALATLAVLLVGGIGFLLRKQTAPSPAVPTERASIFVLPFRSADTNLVREDLRGRITDAFIDSLSLIQGVRTGPRKSGWVRRDEVEARREAGRAFNVRHALTGRVATPPGQISIEVSLFETDGDQKLWSETFIGSTNEIVELEAKAIRHIASMLELEISDAEEQKIHQKLTNNLEALRFRRQASIHRQEGTIRGYARSTEVLSQALQLDPNYLDADIALAYLLFVQTEDLPNRQVWSEYKVRAQKVLQVDNTHYVARKRLVDYQLLHEWDWETAAAKFEELRTENPQWHVMWAIYNRCLGRTNEARLEQEQAERESRSDIVIIYHGAAARFFTERRYDEALRWAEPGLQQTPLDFMLVSLVAQCLIACNRCPEAVALIEKGLAKEKKQDLVSMLACAYAGMGDSTNALKLVQELENWWGGAYVQPYFVARVYAALGDRQKVWEWLNKAFEERSVRLVHADAGGLRTDPAWDGLREEPEFKEVLKKVGLDVWPR